MRLHGRHAVVGCRRQLSSLKQALHVARTAVAAVAVAPTVAVVIVFAD